LFCWSTLFKGLFKTPDHIQRNSRGTNCLFA